MAQSPSKATNRLNACPRQNSCDQSADVRWGSDALCTRASLPSWQVAGFFITATSPGLIAMDTALKRDVSHKVRQSVKRQQKGLDEMGGRCSAISLLLRPQLGFGKFLPCRSSARSGYKTICTKRVKCAGESKGIFHQRPSSSIRRMIERPVLAKSVAHCGRDTKSISQRRGAGEPPSFHHPCCDNSCSKD